MIESNFEEDHIHILFKSTPNVNMQKFINHTNLQVVELLKKKNILKYTKHFGTEFFGKEDIS